jgi:hypothetical protein
MALAAICILMIVVFSNVRIGLIAMVPNVVPILLTLGLAGFLSIGFDIHSIMVGAIALGIAVDDTIHYMHSIEHYMSRGMNLEQAVRRTVVTTGRALLFTSLILGTSFLVNVLAGTEPYINYGLLATAAIFFAFITDICLTPALLRYALGSSRAHTAPKPAATPVQKKTVF